jgi:NADH-ubiquinone oxidoreductase chain 5
MYEVKGTTNYIKMYHFFNKKWYFDRIYNEFVSQKVIHLGYHYFYKVVDRGFIEAIGPFGLVNSIISISDFVKKFQTGFVIHYLAYFLFFVVFLFLLTFKQTFLLILALFLFAFFN